MPQRAPIKLLEYIISTTYPVKDDKIKPARQSLAPPFDFHHIYRRHDMLCECCFAIFPALVAVNHSIWKGRLQFFLQLFSCRKVSELTHGKNQTKWRQSERKNESERAREKLEKANHSRGPADISESSSDAQSKWLPCVLSSLVCIFKK